MEASIFDGKGGSRTLEMAGSDKWQQEEGTVWLHLDLLNAEHRSWLQRDACLEPLAVEALLAEDTRPRAVKLKDGILLALRGINHHPGADPDDMVALRIWIDRTRIVTTRRRDLLSVEDIHTALKTGRGPVDSADFLVMLTDRIVTRMGDTIDELQEQAELLEEQVMTLEQPELRDSLATLRRQIIAFRRYLAPQREALAQVLVERQDWLGAEKRLQLREVSDRLQRHIEDLDEVREQAVITYEELLGRQAEQLNVRLYVMSVLAALFLPLTFLTGLLGVNIGGIPGAGNPWAFVLFLLLLAAVGGMQLLFFRWRGWV